MIGDPELKCYMPGVPRATYMPFPFQIVQGSSPYILMAYEFTSATRTIRMNWKQEAPTDVVDGLVARPLGRRHARRRRHGTARRDLVRSRRRFSQRTARGRALHAGQPVSPDVRSDDRRSEGLHAAVEDQLSAVSPDGEKLQLLEFKCVPFTEELLYGKFSKKTGGAR